MTVSLNGMDSSESKTVMVVDDVTANLQFISFCLQQCGFKVITVCDGASALMEVEKAPPDLILLDVMMPAIDGFEVCRRLKADTKWRDIPVIFMTAKTGTEDKVRAFGLGAVDYISKPFQREEIIARVTTHLHLYSMKQNLEQKVRERTHALTTVNQKLRQQIVERERVEKALRESEQRFRALVTQAADAMILHDMNGQLLDVNERTCEGLGYARDELLQMNIADIEVDASGNLATPPAWSDLPRRQPRTLESLYKHKNGRRFPVEIRMTRLRIENQDTIFALARDISERKTKEAQLHGRNRELALLNRIIAASANENRIEKILDIACRELAVTFKLPQSAALLWHNEAKELEAVAEYITPDVTAFTEQRSILNKVARVRDNASILNPPNPIKPLSWDKIVDHADYDVIGDLFEDRGARTLLLLPLAQQDKLSGYLVLESFVQQDFNAEQIRLAKSVADQVSGVLARIRVEIERLRLEDQYYQAQKMEALGKLTGGVAHDFNNILTIILGASDLLRHRYGPDTAPYNNIKQIYEAAGRAAGLVSQLMAFSRQQVLQPTVLNLNVIVRNFEIMLARVIGEDIEMVTKLDPKLKQVTADPGQIEQVLMNLAVNARDAMPQGGKLTIETANVHLGPDYMQQHVDVIPGDYVMISISDSGVGIPAERQKRIFDPFYTTKPKGEGTGLGLSTVHGIVKQSGGHIWVYSEAGHGTVFKIYLPHSDAPTEQDNADDDQLAAVMGSETLLVVEDEKILQEMIETILSRFGYQVILADCGEHADQVCAAHDGPIDLLLTDVVIPGGENGVQLAQRLSTNYPQMKVIFMSGYTESAIVHHGVSESDAAFLQKPFLPEALAQKVRSVLDCNGG